MQIQKKLSAETCKQQYAQVNVRYLGAHFAAEEVEEEEEAEEEAEDAEEVEDEEEEEEEG
jgi:hypothetical protein